MALDAVSFMRTRVRGTPSWPGHNPETGYVGADQSGHLAQAACRRGGPYVFARDPRRAKKRHTVPYPTATPRAASAVRNSSRVMSGVSSTRERIKPARASIVAERP